MTDQPGRPEEQLPARRPDAVPAPAERFTAPPSAHAFELTPERAAGIVRQTANARWVGFLAILVVVLFVIVYYFYELGVPGVPNSSRLGNEVLAQQVTSIERGYDIYQANCARCHGVNGQGFANSAGAPPLNEQDKLFAHLNPTYLANVLREGGRYVCGNATSLMPVWSSDNGGPLNYQQIDDLIAFIRALNTQTYIVRDPSTDEPVIDPTTGKVETFTGWVDPTYKPAPGATPFPDCWSSAFSSGASSGASPAATPAPGATVVDITAQNIAFTTTSVTAPAGKPFAIVFDNQDSGVPHNVEIKDSTGAVVFKGAIVTGVIKTTYDVPALAAGTYPFQCTVHPNMTGTLTVK
ncbi:MAG: cupredoxin domain-containing protein [Candidatus Limnocylindrales bacterium]